MSGRRSRNPRWLAWGIAVAIGSLASVGVGLAPVHATAAPSTTSDVEAPRLGSTPSAARGEPRPNIKFRGPQFVVQPRLVGRNLSFVVKVNPYRTADNNSSAKADILRGQIDVSRSGVAISTVGLDRKDRTKQLIFTTKFKERVVRSAGRIEYQIRLPLAVARSLAATPVSERTTRVRVVLVHAKDTKPSLRWRETLELAQSSLEPLPTARSLAATSLLPTTRKKQPNVNALSTVTNNTPFTLQVSTQPTQCVKGPQWNGSMAPGQSLSTGTTVLYSGNPNGLSTWQNLGQSAVTSLQGAAEDAAQDAIVAGPESFTPEGAAEIVVNFTKNFLLRFIISSLEQPTCENTPGTWVISTVATGLPLPLWQGTSPGDVAEWAVNSAGQPFQSGPPQTPAQLASTLGAQTSVQWNWNGGNVAANGPGASYFSGGLIQTAFNQDVKIPLGGGLYNTIISYQNNAQDSYGPIQTSNVTLTASAGDEPNGNTPGVNLVCTTGIWSFTSPWGSYTYNLSNPPNSSSSSQLVTIFYYNGVDASGNSWPGQPIPGIDTIVSDYTDNSQPQVWVDTGTMVDIFNNSSDGTMITSWGCSVQAQSQVPSFQEPPGWPTNSNTSNLSWYSVPFNATAPDPNP